MVWKVPPLSSGGLILSYQCSNQCRHCLYASDPAWTEWISRDRIDKIMQQLSRHSKLLTGIHIGGGEPLLDPELSVYTVRKACEFAIPIDYVETNAFWCWNEEKTVSVFSQLKDAGLPAILISVSPFHLEFIPQEKVKRAVRIGQKIFGPQGIIFYTQYFYDQFQELPEKDTVPLEDYVQAIGPEEASLTLTDQYGLIPSGRVVTHLESLFEHYPASNFFGETCERELSNPYHVHIDLYGNYIGGLCAGISLGNGLDLDALFTGIDLAGLPVLNHLITGGVESLFEWAVREFNYKERLNSYIAKCHLCLDIRQQLIKTGFVFKELVPLEYYTHLEAENLNGIG